MYLQIGADIVKRALAYPARQIAKNAGVNGSTVINKVLLHTCLSTDHGKNILISSAKLLEVPTCADSSIR